MLRKEIPPYFKERRDRMMKKNAGSAFIFYSGPEQYRQHDVEHPYRQDTNFFYLTGFEEPESYLVLAPAAKGGYSSTLFVRNRDPQAEIWTGERYGVDRVCGFFSVDQAYPNLEFESRLPELLKFSEQVYVRMGRWHKGDEEFDRKMFNALDRLRLAQGRTGKSQMAIRDPNEVVGEMRLFKQPEEVRALREACRITALGHKTLMEEVKPGMNEYEMEALFEYVVKKSGCRRLGYGSIVAGGKNATYLHYRENNEPLRDGDLLLVDAAGEFDYYTSDITRTTPVGKKFSAAQAKIYDLVLKAQKETIAMCKPGIRYASLHEKASEILAEGLISMGILSGNAREVVASGAIKRFYPHGTGHWLGLDVHDSGLYKHGEDSRLVEAGMVFTVEPGLYFQPGDTNGVPKEFQGVGVRIEDDILITDKGCEVMTAGAPKERAEIESLR